MRKKNLIIVDSAGPSAMVSAQYLWDAVVEVKKTGVKIRFITEITKDNLSSCKTMMTKSETSPFGTNCL